METSTKIIGLAILGILVLGVVATLGFALSTYNDLQKKDVSVENHKAYVQSAYQRRADLIPNLVATVQGSADFEKSTLVELTEMRSQAGSIQQKVTNAGTIEEMDTAGSEMTTLLSRLMVVVEAYPTIKTTDAFMNLQSQIEGTENRINYERNEYNDAVQEYKISVRVFPASIVANFAGLREDKWKMFTASAGSEVAPTVSFDFNT